MDADSISLIIALIVLLLFSAFFSGAETSFSTYNKSRMKTYSAAGKKRADLALRLSDDYNTLISTLLVGNNIANIAASSFATVLFTKHFGSSGVAISTVVMTLVVLVFGEITPKNVAKDFPEKFAMVASPFVNVLRVLFWPINFIFSLWKKLIGLVIKKNTDPSLTEEELITMIEEAESDGSIDEQEGELIRSAIEFNDVEVENILTPRVDIVAVCENADIDEISEAFRTHRFSRLPVYDDSIDHIIGIMHEKDFNAMLYDKKSDIKEILHDVVYVPEKMKISKLLRVLQEAKVHMAIVVDEFGGTSGIVTLEDVLEGLVGEIWDEHDEVSDDFKKISDNEYIVLCKASYDEFREMFSIEDESDESATVGGWVLDKIGKIPEEGFEFDYENLHVKVISVENRRISEIRVTIKEAENENE